MGKTNALDFAAMLNRQDEIQQELMKKLRNSRYKRWGQYDEWEWFFPHRCGYMLLESYAEIYLEDDGVRRKRWLR